MDASGNGHAQEGSASTRPVYTFAITYDPATEDFSVVGLNNPPWVVLGMLEYATVLVRRRDAEAAMMQHVQNAPRIARPGGR